MAIDAQDEFVANLVESFSFQDASLPALPDAVIYLQNALADDSLDMVTLVRMLEKDPVLAMRIVSVANSALFRTVQPAESVADAVFRVGLATTRNVSLISLRNGFQARHPAIGHHIGQLWMESLRVAVIAAAMTEHVRIVDANRAMLGGLLCNVGPMLLLTVIDKKLTGEIGPNVLDVMLEKSGARFGELLLQHWGMDPELVLVAAHAHDVQRENDSGVDLADLIIVARHCSLLREQDPEDDLSALDSGTAHGRVMSKSRSDATMRDILDGANERIEETYTLLAA